MNTKKNINKLFFVLLILFGFKSHSQNVSVYKIDNLLKRIHNNSDTLYIVNFWATWCKPCVAELPDFEKVNTEYKNQKIKVLLVSMDFIEDIDKKLKPFLLKNNYTAEVVLLDEGNGNDFINKVSPKWGGAIPATLITKKNNEVSEFFEKKLNYELLVEQITKYK